MENGITNAAKSAENSLHITLTSGSTKYRTHVLRSLQQDLDSAGLSYWVYGKDVFG